MVSKNKLMLLVAVFAFGITSSCNVNNQSKVTAGNCDTQAPVIKTISNEKGILMVDAGTGKATVNVHTPGTVDEVAVYHICNTPAKLPANNKNVTVSGKVRASKEVSELAGYKHYELEIESLEEL